MKEGNQKLAKVNVKMSGGGGGAKVDVNIRMKNQFSKIRSGYCVNVGVQK